MNKILMVYDPENEKYYLRGVALTVLDTNTNEMQYICARPLGLTTGYANFSEATAAFRAAVEEVQR